MDNDGVLSEDNQDEVWLGKIPEMISKKERIPFKEAYDFCVEEYKKFEGMEEWYNVLFWEKRFGIKFKHLIKPQHLFEDAKEFLKKFGSQTIVVTAAHPSIIEITTKSVKPLVRKIYSTFDFGLIKENPAFFHAVIKKEHLIPENIIFVDDKVENVNSARKAGIKSFLLDRSSKEKKEGIIHSLRELM